MTSEVASTRTKDAQRCGPIRRLREARGLTQRDLASRAGITVRALYDLEQQRSRPSVGTALFLALALGCEPADLVEGGDG